MKLYKNSIYSTSIRTVWDNNHEIYYGTIGLLSDLTWMGYSVPPDRKGWTLLIGITDDVPKNLRSYHNKIFDTREELLHAIKKVIED